MSGENYISKEELKSTLSDLYLLRHILNVIFNNIFDYGENSQARINKQKENAYDASRLISEIILHLENNEIVSF